MREHGRGMVIWTLYRDKKTWNRDGYMDSVLGLESMDEDWLYGLCTGIEGMEEVGYMGSVLA